MSNRKARCHYDGELGWLSPEHLRDCKAADCAGCKPCGKTHCAMRGRCAEHVEPAAGIITCPRCIGKVRRDLGAIEDLYAAVEVEAWEAGVESEALSLAGPAPLPTTAEARRRWLRSRDHKRGWCDWPSRIHRDDPHHPYAVLGRWDMALREQYGPRTALAITVSRAADYLRGLLAGPFPHGDEFEEFARDLATCRTHLEAVIHDSRMPEEGRQCPWCIEERGKGPRLRKRYADGTDPKTKRGDHDTWHCPDDPAHWCSERDYRNRVAVDYVEHASDLPAAELAERLGVPLSTVRKWAARVWDDEAKSYREPLLKSRRRGADGRKLYRVADALRLAERRGA